MRTKKSKQLVREELKKILYKRMLTENTNPFKKGDSVVVVKVFGTTHSKQSDARRFTGKKGIVNDIQGDYVFVNLKGFRSPSIEFHKNEIDWTDAINERIEGSFVITDKTKPGTYLQTYKKDGAGSSWTRDIKNAMVFGTHGSASSVIGDQVDKWQSRWIVKDINKLNENSAERFYKSAGLQLARQGGKGSPSYDTLMNLLNSTPLGSKIGDEEKQKVVGYAMNELGIINEERTSTISKARAKSSLKQIEKGKRDDGMGKFDAKVYAKKDDNEVELKKLADLDKYSSGYTYHLKENELPYKLGGSTKIVMIDMNVVIDALKKGENDENVIALISELPPGPLEHLAFLDKWLRFEEYYEETDGEKLSKILVLDLGLNDDEIQIIVDDYIDKRKNAEQESWYEAHDKHTKDEEWSGPAGGADVTPEEVHQAAEQAGIAWDGDEAFLDFSEKITGVRHIDTMNSELRFKLIDALKYAVPQIN